MRLVTCNTGGHIEPHDLLLVRRNVIEPFEIQNVVHHVNAVDLEESDRVLKCFRGRLKVVRCVIG